MDESKINISQNLSLQGEGQRKFIKRKHLNLALFSPSLVFLDNQNSKLLFPIYSHIMKAIK